MPTTTRILQLAPICCYLANDYKAKRNGLFGGNATANNQATLIYMVYKVAKFIYDRDPTYSGLDAVAQYLWELCQKFAYKAAQIYDEGGGEVVPTTSTGLPTPYNFIVSGSSFIATGESTVTMPTSWRGYNLTFDRGGQPQSQVDTEPTYFTYNTTTRQLTISPAAIVGELFVITPV